MSASSSKAVAAMCAAVAVSPKAAEVQSLDDVRRVLAELQETHKRLQTLANVALGSTALTTLG